MKILTCIFKSTPELINLLKIFLYSARKHEEKTEIIVYHVDLENDFIDEIHGKVKNIIFKQIEYSLKIKKEMASQKMMIWKLMISDLHENEEAILMDCDMLVVDKIGDVLSQYDCDFAYTAKDDIKSRCPLNTGIVFFRKNDLSVAFFEEWCDKTDEIVKIGLHKNDVLQYGAIDQFVLCKMLGDSPYLGNRKVGELKVCGLRSSEYNLHKHWNVIQQAKIIHYKSSWRNILFRNSMSYEESMVAEKWDRNPEHYLWKTSYNIWKKYEKEYKNIQ